jgi:hypothetical protein
LVLLLVCCAGKAFDELEAYLGQNDWAAFRAVAVLLGHILGASLQVRTALQLTAYHARI